MSIRYDNMQDMLDNIAPTAFEGRIGFMGYESGDITFDFTKLDPANDAKQLAPLLQIPEHPSSELRDIIDNRGKGENRQEHVALTILTLLQNENERPLRLARECKIHVYVEPVRLWLTDILDYERN